MAAVRDLLAHVQCSSVFFPSSLEDALSRFDEDGEDDAVGAVA